jgi:Predicted nucleotide-binding protein containing TIR-like domain
MYSDAHKSASGLLEIILGHSLVKAKLEELYRKQFENNGSFRISTKYKRICVIDTFFSDTLDKGFWKRVVAESKITGILIQIVLLNPFSESAMEREKSLKVTGRITRMNEGLSRIIEAMDPENAQQQDTVSANHKHKASYIFEQLIKIERLRAENNHKKIEIKFVPTNTFPMYVIGEYAGLGQFLSTGSATDKPWLFWVNCPQDNDQFDHILHHFDTLWNEQAKPFTAKHLREYTTERKLYHLLGEKEKIFISHGSKNEIRKDVFEILEKYGKQGKHFEESYYKTENKPFVATILNEMYANCSAAIIILTCDDELKNGIKRGRQNVILELGECRARYGDEKVLLLVETGVEIPSNVGDLIYSKLVINDRGILTVNQAAIYDFLQKIDRTRQEQN